MYVHMYVCFNVHCEALKDSSQENTLMFLGPLGPLAVALYVCM